ncbi:MAG: hypothetical protein R3E48_03395 [Burkholderiaceae bacterium]
MIANKRAGDAGEHARDNERDEAHPLLRVADELGALGAVAHRIGDAPDRRAREAVHQVDRQDRPDHDQVVDLDVGREPMPKNGGASVRSSVMPSSPPENFTKISEDMAIISPIPSEIIANTVPARLVEKLPKITAKTSLATPPITGTKITNAHRWHRIALIRWIAR